MQTFLRRKSNLLTLKLVCSESYQKYKFDILRSQFHRQGYRHFKKSRTLIRYFSTNATDIEKLLKDLDAKRLLLQNSPPLANANLDELPDVASQGDYKRYFQAYLKLIESVKESKFNQQWFYCIVGWYNLQEFQQQLFHKLFTFTNKKEHLLLVDSLAWMDPYLFTPTDSTDLYDVKKQRQLVQNYYKKLNRATQIPLLQKIETLLDHTSNSYKGRFYSKYLQQVLPTLLKTLNPNNQKQVDDLFWLLNLYFREYNDNPNMIEKIENYLCHKSTNELSQHNIEILIKIYNLMGRMNPKIYEKYIKPYLLIQSKKSVEKQVFFFEFLINSQTDDLQTLNLLLEQIEKEGKQNSLEDQVKHKLHFLIHYMNIVKIPYKSGIQFNKKLSECCRDHDGYGSIARMMSIQLDQKGRRDGNTYFISDCLRKNRLNAPVKEDVGYPSKKLPKFKQYNNIRFCTIPIDTCIVNDQTKQAVVIEKNYRKFEHSGKLPRYLEIRDTILKHYGFKINYMKSMYSIREPKETEFEDSDTIEIPNII